MLVPETGSRKLRPVVMSEEEEETEKNEMFWER